MFSKSFTASIFLLALTSFVNANCIITPALGVSGSPRSSDVQHPSDAAPCGTIPIAQNLDSSNTIQADENGRFMPLITNFASGADGSRSIKTAKVDSSGKGDNFVDCQIVTNGDDNPTSQGTQQLVVELPAGTKCTGGTTGNMCLVSFVTSADSGNCVVVTQGETAVQNSTASTSPNTGKVHTDAHNGGQTKQNQKSSQKTQNQNTDQSTQNQKSGSGTLNRMIRKRRA